MSSVNKSTNRPSPAEVTFIKAQFAQYDTDKDSGIDQKEFLAMTEKMGIHLPAADADKLFQEMDVDSSGKIEMGEFVDHWAEIVRRAQEAQEKVKTTLAQTTSFTKEEIDAMHCNFQAISKRIHDDGVIDPEEFKHMMCVGGGIPKWNSVLLDGLFRMFDANRSGMITFEEFVKSLSIFHGKMTGNSQPDRQQLLFDIYDVDQDKKINDTDLIRVLDDCCKGSGIQLGEEYLKELVTGTLNGKSVDLDEFKKMTAE